MHVAHVLAAQRHWMLLPFVLGREATGRPSAIAGHPSIARARVARSRLCPVINVHFVYLGAAIGALGSLVYMRDTLRGTTQPNRVTWLLWAFAPLLAAAVEFRSGVGLRTLDHVHRRLHAAARLRRLVPQSGRGVEDRRLDYVCGAMSLAGTAAWLATRNGVVAIAAAIAADFLAGVPTLMKSWSHPESESVSSYIGAVANSGILAAHRRPLDHRGGGLPAVHPLRRLRSRSSWSGGRAGSPTAPCPRPPPCRRRLGAGRHRVSPTGRWRLRAC